MDKMSYYLEDLYWKEHEQANDRKDGSKVYELETKFLGFQKNMFVMKELQQMLKGALGNSYLMRDIKLQIQECARKLDRFKKYGGNFGNEIGYKCRKCNSYHYWDIVPRSCMPKLVDC